MVTKTLNTKCGRLLSYSFNKLHQTYKKFIQSHGADYARSHPQKEYHTWAVDWTHLWEMEQWGMTGKLFMQIIYACIIIIQCLLYYVVKWLD